MKKSTYNINNRSPRGSGSRGFPPYASYMSFYGYGMGGAANNNDNNNNNDNGGESAGGGESGGDGGGMNESMNVSVVGGADKFGYYNTRRLMDLSFMLEKECYKILGDLPEDQIEYFRKNRPAELLVPDGNADIDAPTGILNLYYSGYTKGTLNLFLEKIKKVLAEKKIKLGEVKVENSGAYKYQVIRLPIVENNSQFEGQPEVNMSNRNAYHIFKNVLGFEPEDSTGSSFLMTVVELEAAVNNVLKNDPNWVKDNEIKPNVTDDSNPHDQLAKDISAQLSGTGDEDDETSAWSSDEYSTDSPKGAKFYSGGLDSEQMHRRLEGIIEIIEWAKKHGFEKISVA